MKSQCTSPTDPLPLSLYHKLSPLFFPIFLYIIANSLNSGQVSPCLKTAIISPILKKTKLDPNSFSNYHPISHSPLLSKILEIIVSKQLIAHIYKNNNFDPFQSAFRKNHSTEILSAISLTHYYLPYIATRVTSISHLLLMLWFIIY